jgi:hAT family C-terminal dimerisation region
LIQRFDSNDLKQYQALEDILVGVQSNDVLEKYPELDGKVLMVQLQMFKNGKSYASVIEAAKNMQELPLEVRKLFPQVERLIRLLMISPASSAEAERSLSSLRRLKTWLRSTMTQKRLNVIAVCHAHQDILDSLDMTQLEREFISRSDIRKNLFGKI